jgi:hypothetical protein
MVNTTINRLEDKQMRIEVTEKSKWLLNGKIFEEDDELCFFKFSIKFDGHLFYLEADALVVGEEFEPSDKDYCVEIGDLNRHLKRIQAIKAVYDENFKEWN